MNVGARGGEQVFFGVFFRSSPQKISTWLTATFDPQNKHPGSGLGFVIGKCFLPYSYPIWARGGKGAARHRVTTKSGRFLDISSFFFSIFLSCSSHKSAKSRLATPLTLLSQVSFWPTCGWRNSKSSETDFDHRLLKKMVKKVSKSTCRCRNRNFPKKISISGEFGRVRDTDFSRHKCFPRFIFLQVCPVFGS